MDFRPAIGYTYAHIFIQILGKASDISMDMCNTPVGTISNGIPHFGDRWHVIRNV